MAQVITWCTNGRSERRETASKETLKAEGVETDGIQSVSTSRRNRGKFRTPQWSRVDPDTQRIRREGSSVRPREEWGINE